MSEPSLFEVLNVLKWDLERIQKTDKSVVGDGDAEDTDLVQA